MILPEKHTYLEQSLLGFGGYLLQIIGKGTTVDFLWQEYQKDFSAKRYSAKHNFDSLLRALVFLYSLNAIEEFNGEIRKCI